MVKLYPSWFVFFAIVLVGIMFVVSGDSWFSVWVGFELSLLGFLPMFSATFLVVESMVKYFLVQAGGSVLFLFSFLSGDYIRGELVMLLGMSMKLGLFPFYQWVPVVMSGLSWVGCFLLSSVQKVGPLFIIMCHQVGFLHFVILMSVSSVLVSGILGFNQSYLRSLMGYSSISHTGWMICSGVTSLGLFMLYFLIYSLVLFFLFLSFDYLHLVQVVGGYVGLESFLLLNLLLLTLSGVPPFFIFFFKVSIIHNFCLSPFVVLGLILGSMLSVYYYLTFVIPSVTSYFSGSLSASGSLLLLSSLFSPLFLVSLI